MPRASRSFSWDQLTHSRLFLLVMAGIVLFVLVAFLREAVHRYEVRQQITKLQAEIGDLETKQKKLTDLIDFFSSPLFQEQEARQKLGKAKPGESVVIIPLSNVNASPTHPSAAQAPQQQEQDVSNPARWWRYFFAS